jgi:hypothetical protein
LVGERQTAEQRREYYDRIFGQPGLIASLQDERSLRHGLPNDKPISRRLAKDLIAAWREMQEREEDNAT